jgi:hypothetical protein
VRIRFGSAVETSNRAAQTGPTPDWSTHARHVPANSLVANIVHERQLGPRRVLVFVYAADDPYAPRVVVPRSCPD